MGPVPCAVKHIPFSDTLMEDQGLFPLALVGHTLYDTPCDIDDYVKKPKWLYHKKKPRPLVGVLH